jgi:hypothetical protein
MFPRGVQIPCCLLIPLASSRSAVTNVTNHADLVKVVPQTPSAVRLCMYTAQVRELNDATKASIPCT